MKVLIKNNLLKREAKIGSLSELKDKELEALAKKFQMSLFKIVKEDVQVDKSGVMQKEEQLSHQPKPRSVLENEFRRKLTISCTIPREYWNKDQYYIWQSNNVGKLQDIVEINRYKGEMGILVNLPPFEEGLDNLNTSKLLQEVTEDQWEYLKDRFNYREKVDVSSKTGLKETKRYHIPNLVVHEWAPEDDADVEKLKKMEQTEAVKFSLKKNGIQENKTK